MYCSFALTYIAEWRGCKGRLAKDQNGLGGRRTKGEPTQVHARRVILHMLKSFEC